MCFIGMVRDVVKHAEIDLFYFRNAKVAGSTPVSGTISNTSQVYRNQLKARVLRLQARILSPVINWTQPESSYSWGHK